MKIRISYLTYLGISSCQIRFEIACFIKTLIKRYFSIDCSLLGDIDSVKSVMRLDVTYENNILRII